MKIHYEGKRQFFDEGHTRHKDFRISQLNKLRKMISDHEKAIEEALFADLKKPAYEAYTSEIGILYNEIDLAIEQLETWMKPVKVKTPTVLKPATSTVYPEPLGVVLVIGPWNYPFQLVMAPLIGAIAAGNCVVIKPSELAPKTEKLIETLIHNHFSSDYISVVTGDGAEVLPQLIEENAFNHIFFTGSPGVGKHIMRYAAAHLTPVTLELGGKSPAIVMADANLEVAARRIIYAKCFNAGQTCVSPDYLLVHESVKAVFIEKLVSAIKQFYGKDPQKSPSYGRILNERRFDALEKLLAEGNVLYGGERNREALYIEPTLIEPFDVTCELMKEEIFGPILPILSFKELPEVVHMVRKNRYPLALYLFTESEAHSRYVVDRIEFGGGCINQGLVHLVNGELPFGGVMSSGTGRYHGRYSFETFSHYKSVLHAKTWIDTGFMYPPYGIVKGKLAKQFMK